MVVFGIVPTHTLQAILMVEVLGNWIEVRRMHGRGHVKIVGRWSVRRGGVHRIQIGVGRCHSGSWIWNILYYWCGGCYLKNEI